MNSRLCAFLFMSLWPFAAYAANPGDACTAGQTGQVQVDAGTMIVCNGTTWNLALQLSSNAGRILFQVDNDGGTCTTAKTGRLKYNGAGSPAWQYCDGSDWLPFEHAPAAPGYLVQTATKWNGNLGGLSGANAKCLTELQTTYDWKGKTDAGTLTPARVKAFLCDSASCNNLQPGTFYMMAKAGSTTAGGSAFKTDTNGSGPGVQNYWDDNGFSAGPTWTSRAAGTAALWGTTPYGSNHCSDWGSTSGNGRAGDASDNDAMRWNEGNYACNGARYLYCFVDP